MGWGRLREGAGKSRWRLRVALGLGGKKGSCFSPREEGKDKGRVRAGQRGQTQRKELSRLWEKREKGREIQERQR